MIRFMRYLWGLHRREQQWAEDRRYLLFVECVTASYEQCLLATAHCKRVPHEQIGVVAKVLHCRTSRGTTTLEHALDMYAWGREESR